MLLLRLLLLLRAVLVGAIRAGAGAVLVLVLGRAGAGAVLVLVPGCPGAGPRCSKTTKDLTKDG